MSNYRRAYQSGACYFFTVVTNKRQAILTDSNVLQRLSAAFLHVQKTRPFIIEAIVILPDHIHSLWHLPEDNNDFSICWRMIKHYVSIGVDAPINDRKEKLFWQRRFWEHLIRDEDDWRRHMDYIHYNPVKHGYVTKVSEWPHSSFHQAVKEKLYPPDWGIFEPDNIRKMDIE